MKINVDFNNDYNLNFVYSDAEIISIAQSMLNYAIQNHFNANYPKDYDYAFDIMLCDNDFIHNINRAYRKIDKPTDVITFSLFADSEDKIIVENSINLGQIIISADKVNVQAEENNVTSKYEFLNLLSHGILHLIGFDHKDDNALTDMLKLQGILIESVKNVKI